MKPRSSLVICSMLGFALAIGLPLLHAEGAAGGEKAAAKPRKETMRAEITKIEATSITVGKRTFNLDAKVQVRINNETKTIADLKVGDVVKVKGVQETDGTFTARAILLEPTDKTEKPKK